MQDIISENSFLSIVIPTYNESENILKLIDAIIHHIPSDISSEILIVDNDSPDRTGILIEEYIKNITNETYNNTAKRSNHKNNCKKKCSVKVIHRHIRDRLIPTILDGVRHSSGQNILIMNADFSHPPEIIPRIINELNQDPNCVVVASRYIKGGSIVGWPFKRLMLNIGAVRIARHSLKLRNIKDPISGFFALPSHTLKDIEFDAQGFKMLLEILVKGKNLRVKEIPYIFNDRKFRKSKLDTKVILEYSKAIWQLYRYGRNYSSNAMIQNKQERRGLVLFLSKAARFFTVGASGLLINYLISSLLSDGTLFNFWYVHGTLIGIIFSITSNFLLNKSWTFEDKDFSLYHTLKQYGLFVAFSSIGASIQLLLVYLLVESGLSYSPSLIIAVASASISNFLLNKKFTFHEKIWS
ncbi:MAG: Undecaprenyl-phosphate mannosyltransferase [Nitrososphaeraceae archaeon]|jgi:dolichol-phosphate mannosyltransferase|nr:Undecaprenyl-phosphate mannosyltransferase [Nitrososphaeraceae archaeon]MDF2767962.1 Undecaprenyl-phosphate mannosyltransferase [Nitrososphaeraceae archaeon]